MDQLDYAESIDFFVHKTRQDPINALARAHLSYTPMNHKTMPWLDSEIITMHPTAEAGLPHTRPPHYICLPAYYPDSLKAETLAHEYIHIDQRKRPAHWNYFFKKEGWTPLPTSEVPSRWLNRCRMNPDTIDQRFWAWKDRFVPLPLYEREDKPDLRHVVIHWWDRETGSRQPEAPRLFMERYGAMPSQPEHPRELAAVELAKLFHSQSDIDIYLNR